MIARTRLLSVFATALLILVVAGCTTRYTKPGLTQEQFDRDAYECRKDANVAASGAAFQGTSNPFALRETLAECMRLKGYTRE